MQRTQSPSKTKKDQLAPEYTSIDAPPLDFSFKNIHTLQQIKTTVPRKGQRKQMTLQPQQAKKQEEGKQKEEQQPLPEKQEKKIQKKGSEIIRLQVDNTNNALISSLINNTNLKNTSGKNKEEKDQELKRQIQINLICTTLILSYNKLRSLDGFAGVMETVMMNFNNLQWIDLSHNYIQMIDYDFKDVPQLKVLYLHCNYIYDMNVLKKLDHLSELKTLTIHGNPLTNVPSFRIYVIGMLPGLKKLDSVVVSRKQRDNSRVWVKTTKPYPIPKNYIRAPALQKQKNQNEYS